MPIRLTATLLAVLLALPAAAASLKYRPGKWKTTTTMQMAGMAEQTRTSTECLQDGEYSAEELMKDQDGCNVDTPVVRDDTMHWAVACDFPTGAATGKGQYTVEDGGERGNGTVVITMNVQGQELTNTMRFETERVGDCD